MAERGCTALPPWWDEPVRRAPGPHPLLPWDAGGPPDRSGHLRVAGRPAHLGVGLAGLSRRPAALLAVAVLAGVVALALVGAAGGTGTVATPFLTYSPPPGWSAAPADPAAARAAPALVGVVHGPRYTCGGEELLRGYAAAALLPTDLATGSTDRAERVARWFAATAFSAADGTPPQVTVAPPRTVRVGGPDEPVDGTVTEVTARAAVERDGCAATAGRVLVLSVPADGGAALLLVAGDTAGGPNEPTAPDPSTLDAVVASVRLPAT